jgi:hypothetical protein
VSKPPLTIAQTLGLIRDPELTHDRDKGMAAGTLLEYYRHDPQFTISDMLRCLDYGGYIAEVGARCLYVRTGREERDLFVVDRSDWERYLREHLREQKG